jgi:hypothetical protein
MWLYQEKEFTSDMVSDHIGCVYIIENLLDSRKYIGKKLFWFNHIKIIKGKRKRVKIQSDWEVYYGSSIELQNDVSHFGEHNFTRKI